MKDYEWKDWDYFDGAGTCLECGKHKKNSRPPREYNYTEVGRKLNIFATNTLISTN